MLLVVCFQEAVVCSELRTVKLDCLQFYSMWLLLTFYSRAAVFYIHVKSGEQQFRRALLVGPGCGALITTGQPPKLEPAGDLVAAGE